MAWGIAASLVLLLALLTLLLLPIRLYLTVVQNGWQADLTVEAKYALFRYRQSADVTQAANTALEHMWKRWRQTGKAVAPDLAETMQKAPRRKLLRAALPAIRRLGRGTRCHRFGLRIQVGGHDAMESALLAGAFWGMAGVTVGQVSRFIRLPRSAMVVAVVPDFDRAEWRLNFDCILTVRLGQAIMAIVWLLRRELGRKEVIAWVRDSLRRKGDKTDGRAPDPRPDEGGDGEP